MKKTLLLVLIVFIYRTSIGQIWFHHVIKQSTIDAYGFDLRGGSPISPVNLCTKRYGLVTVANGKINVDIWQIKDDTTCANGIDKNTSLRDLNLQIIDERATLGDPTKVLILPFQSINLGVNTIPFRIRTKVKVDENEVEIPATGTSSFQLAFNVGYTWGFSQITTRAITNWSATLGVYAGPSTAELKKETVERPSLWTINQTNATLTYGFNLILARNNFGLVFAYGFEHALGKNKAEWVYKGKPYFGFGINAGFMK
ncbi:MAG TPA: hypothetical protein VK625_13720 [Flavitalea sp.]|nr:hypothetical protein [Flavitalea sp.]